ncbi:prepilin-type N-terminal cleavage/methylation domain-containing protein [Paenalcaligenes niemegkensis]|uniref:prepilin-type N-terminal cleavage/methylation domain-containing protein n=1 Tax=Paenalcaligenes niemegkensis TaxID=2895469 RepID=UPI001EE858FC|nr:prepilin-type N-terminal cleavage/methylation domain-containing protein [Paenalcaligenes niemegkensis]MCQ9616744.1 prepilin-type N-terminal cleavage/methylation domain-containing protein [Paenalcaligenes niemegkensis]
MFTHESKSVSNHFGGCSVAARSANTAAQAVALQRQGGFSLVEVSLVTAIVLLLAVIAVPAINNYVIENRVPKVAEELARFMLNNEISAPTSVSNPYNGINLNTLAHYVSESGVLDIRGQGGQPEFCTVWEGTAKCY